MNINLNDSSRIVSIKEVVASKPSLKAFYDQVYKDYSENIEDIKNDELIIELGAGSSYFKDIRPQITSTDIIPYPGLDMVVDACAMPFQTGSVSAFLLSNVLHHIPNAEKFFQEADRCLRSGGKIVIFDQYPGLISKPILKYFHHEAFDEKSASWSFHSTGPLSSANGALPWNIFFRDRLKFDSKFKKLRIKNIEHKVPLFYWLCGGLKNWTLIPKPLISFFMFLDKILLKISRHFGSFILIVIEKR